MSHLAPCPACNRHIDIAETACPFCAAVLAPSFRAARAPGPPPRRLGRAALMTAGAALMGAAACSASDAISVEKKDATPSYDGSRVVAAYGGPVLLGTGGSGGNVGSGGAVSTGGAGGVTDAGGQGATDAAPDAAPARDASQDRTFIAIYGAPFAADKQPSS